MSKVFTVRLSKDHVEELTSLATFDNVAIAEEIREAIALLLKSRSKDPAFVQRVKDAYDNAGKVLAKLERGPEVMGALGNPVAAVDVEAAGTTRAAAAATAQRTTKVLKASAAPRAGSAARVRSRA